MDEHAKTNLARWNELVGVHLHAPETYDLSDLRAGGTSLKQIEIGEVGDVRGKRLLHLQCHFGMDTISWARAGAKAVGVDFSPKAIEAARELNAELGAEAEFVCSDVYELPDQLDGLFDVVFTSYGVLYWLSDLGKWAEIVDRFLAPGGFFYIVELHPFGMTLSEEGGRLLVTEPYFDVGPVAYEEDGSYADRAAAVENRLSYEWQHPLADVVDALIANGLRIDFLHEFPFSNFQWFPAMRQGDDGTWRVPGLEQIPFLFSLRASKP
jgi:SAM-dependent methyltransferase